MSSAATCIILRRVRLLLLVVVCCINCWNTAIVISIDCTNVRPFQDFSGSSTFFTVNNFYDYGNAGITLCKAVHFPLYCRIVGQSSEEGGVLTTQRHPKESEFAIFSLIIRKQSANKMVGHTVFFFAWNNVGYIVVSFLTFPHISPPKTKLNIRSTVTDRRRLCTLLLCLRHMWRRLRRFRPV